ncbi:MAG: hypothetical protein A2046_12835 [Bacteroidetes bacterium GWA2_30_7]|nr:MAG: hypothetical protein A2046_12835 [Bacteroidetes bacterium GWA2_30_7]
MKPLIIEPTFDTPEIVLDKQKGHFSFSGRSMPENPKEFFNPIIEWIDSYMKNPLNETHVIFKLEYFNTVSSRRIMEILEQFSELLNSGNKIKIDWYYEENDLDMKKAGEEFSIIVGIPIETLIVN